MQMVVGEEQSAIVKSYQCFIVLADETFVVVSSSTFETQAVVVCLIAVNTPSLHEPHTPSSHTPSFGPQLNRVLFDKLSMTVD